METLRSYSSSSPSRPPTATSFDSLQRHLRSLVHDSGDNWTYTIFWKSSAAAVLSWGDGYYMGGSEEDDEEVTDAEWFFLVSMSRTFPHGAGLPGLALLSGSPAWVAGADRMAAAPCYRARQGLVAGLRTMACFPVPDGTVELGSTDEIFHSAEILSRIRKAFFIHGGSGGHIPLRTALDLGWEDPRGMLWIPEFSVQDSPSRFEGRPISCDLAENPRSVDVPPSLGSAVRVAADGGREAIFDERDTGAGAAARGWSKMRRNRATLGLGEPVDNVEAERRRREKMNRLFCALRSSVPSVSKMDRASLLSDTAGYIGRLRSKVQSLESDNLALQAEIGALKEATGSETGDRISSGSWCSDGAVEVEVEVEVKVLDREAIVRVQSDRRRHPAARLMETLRELDLEVCSVNVSVAKEVMIQQVIVKMTDHRMHTQEQLMAALMTGVAEPPTVL